MRRVKRAMLSALAITVVMIVASTMAYASEIAPSGSPISTPEQLLSLEGGGEYYLSSDIDLANYKNKKIERDFTGTLDGNGYKIKNLTQDETIEDDYYENVSYGLFLYANGATFRNITLENVNIDVNAIGDFSTVGALVARPNDCKIINIKTSGKIKVVCDDNKESMVGGIFGIANGYSTISGCENGIDIIVNGGAKADVCGVGYVNSGGNIEIASCKNTGNITVELKKFEDSHIVGIVSPGYNGSGITLKSCVNEGNIKATFGEYSGNVGIYVAGVCNSAEEVVKCGNTGKIEVTGSFKKSPVYVSGLVCTKTNNINQSYNSGKVSVKGTSAPSLLCVAGLACEMSSSGVTGAIKNSYNAGNITYKGKTSKDSERQYAVYGLLGMSNRTKISNCYNTGKITAPKKTSNGAIVNSENRMKKTGNYVTKGKNPFKASEVKTVSKITKKNCPKLSSKYWTYSKSKGRMILKNNKEI